MIYEYPRSPYMWGQKWNLWIKLSHIDYPNYSISDMGGIRNDRFGNQLKGHIGVNGYKQVFLTHKSGKRVIWYIHRIILLAFKGGPPTPDMTVDHINNDRLDNRLINLRWATRREQAANSSYSPNSIMYKKVEQRSLIRVWNSRQDAAIALGLNAKIICDVYSGIRKSRIYGGFTWTNPRIEGYKDEIWKPCIDPNFTFLHLGEL